MLKPHHTWSLAQDWDDCMALLLIVSMCWQDLALTFLLLILERMTWLWAGFLTPTQKHSVSWHVTLLETRWICFWWKMNEITKFQVFDRRWTKLRLQWRKILQIIWPTWPNVKTNLRANNHNNSIIYFFTTVFFRLLVWLWVGCSENNGLSRAHRPRTYAFCVTTYAGLGDNLMKSVHKVKLKQ